MKVENKELIYFKETFRLQSLNIKKFVYRIENHHFSRDEKRILTALLAYRQQKKALIKENIYNRKFENKFHEATRLYVWGVSQNHFNSFGHAIDSLTKSIEMYNDIEEKEFIIYPLCALVVTLANKRALQEIEKYISILKKTETDCEYLQMMKDHALALASYICFDFKTTRDEIEQIFSKKNKFLKKFTPALLLILFSLEIEEDNFEASYLVLEKYKISSGLTVKANYKFMKELLNHYLTGSPLYAYKKDFEDFPELFDQIEVIKALSTKDNESLKRHWNRLHTHNPNLYSKDYKYLDRKCLFKLCLEKYTVQSKSSAENIIEKIKTLSSAMDKLVLIFNYDLIYKKEEIIQLLWNEEMNEVNSARLRKLISRYNKLYPNKLVSKQDTYQKVS